MAGVSGDPGKQVLKGVSRSFYLSLRLLPGPMRGGASLGYLLARTSDTLADTAEAPVAVRVAALDGFAAAVAGEAELPGWPASVVAGAEPQERVLLEKSAGLIAWLRAMDPEQAKLVREVVRVIISGQQLDLRRFERASGGEPVVLENGAALEDYAWRVAGCVGEFWTRLGKLTLGERFSPRPVEEMVARGVAYGKGLQLVNILRDLPVDLANGRCYLPVAEPGDRVALLAALREWIAVADGWVGEGLEYARHLPSRRLRAASVLPALLARETLQALHGADWESLAARVKVPRRRVYQLLWRAFFMNSR
jgi:farnesyl-diphosphate farnesyltransferase